MALYHDTDMTDADQAGASPSSDGVPGVHDGRCGSSRCLPLLAAATSGDATATGRSLSAFAAQFGAAQPWTNGHGEELTAALR